MLSSRHLILLSFSFRSIDLWPILRVFFLLFIPFYSSPSSSPSSVCDMDHSLFLAHEYSIFLIPFIEKTMPPFLTLYLWEKQSTIFVQVYFWTSCSIDVCLLLILPCPDYCGFIGYSEVKYESSTLFLFLKNI